MSLKVKISKLNSKILQGFLWSLIAIIYIAFRLANFSEVRLIDWIACGAMLSMGIYSILEGLKIPKDNTDPKADIK